MPQEWYTGRPSTGGQGGSAGAITNTMQDEANPHNTHQKPKSIKLPTLALDGGVTKACLELGMGENLVQAAKTFTQLYEAWLMEESGMGLLDCIARISNQPAPFPLLMVNASDNTINIIHGIKKFVALFGMQHEQEGALLAFLNDGNHTKNLSQLIKLDRQIGRKQPIGSTLT